MIKAILYYTLLVIFSGAFGFTFATCIHLLGASSVREQQIIRLTEDVLELAKAVRRLEYQSKPATCMECPYSRYNANIAQRTRDRGGDWSPWAYGAWECSKTGNLAYDTGRRRDCPIWPPEGSEKDD